jgi:hypothetical protein
MVPWAPGRVQIQNFLVDTTHSNTYTKWVSMGRPANPNSASAWDELKAAVNLYNTVTTQELATATSPVTLTFAMNYFSVSLFVLTNPDVSAIQPADAARRAFPAAINADTCDGKLVMHFAESGVYSVRLFSTDGKRVFESNRPCAGTTVYAVPASLQGTFVLQCRGPNSSLVKQVVLKP